MSKLNVSQSHHSKYTAIEMLELRHAINQINKYIEKVCDKDNLQNTVNVQKYKPFVWDVLEQRLRA